jgi:hypothetical protein
MPGSQRDFEKLRQELIALYSDQAPLGLALDTTGGSQPKKPQLFDKD